MAAGIIKYKLEGLKELDAALKEFPKATARNTLLRVGKKEMKPVHDAAVRLAPDRPETGGKDLKASIQTQSVKAKERQQSVEIATGPTRWYGRHQEFGTAHHGPHPFMRPAWDVYGAVALLNRLAGSLGSEIEKTRQRVARKAERLAAKMKAL